MLQVDHVRKDFGPVHAVRDVTFSIESQATFGLLGPNGAGKTTTMRMIVGVLAPDGGSIHWNGKAVDAKTRRRFGYLPEERGLYGKMKVRDQIAYFGRLHGLREPALRTRVKEWIDRLGLGQCADRPCAELSKGNQQKVQMACAAAHGPDLLVLDEPFSALDPVNAAILFSILNELRSNGTTLVLSSHQMWQLEHLCARFCIIADGANRASGTLAQLRAEWPTRVIRVAPASGAVRSVIDSVEGAQVVAYSNGTVDYRVPAGTDFAALLRSLVNSAPITRFETMDPSLQEIYLRAIVDAPA
jgi:ABC-2 type transport system ATP-binding protein